MVGMALDWHVGVGVKFSKLMGKKNREHLGINEWHPTLEY